MQDDRVKMDLSVDDTASQPLQDQIDRVQALVDSLPKPNIEAKGPRNLPTPSHKKKVRAVVRESRRTNRRRKPTTRQRRRKVRGNGSSRPKGR